MNDQPQPFRVFWHRMGNSRAGVAAVERARKRGGMLAGRVIQQGVELDLKWGGNKGRLLYAHHGLTGREVLPARSIRTRGLPLEELFDQPGANRLNFLIEIKCGGGTLQGACEELALRIERAQAGARTWIASSSLVVLDVASRVFPDSPRVLFGSIACGRLKHVPKTQIVASLSCYGVAPRPPGSAQILSPVGLIGRSLNRHRALRDSASRHGLDYLPARVAAADLARELAADDFPGAFLYAHPDRLLFE